MVEAPPAQAPALEDPVGFEALSDDLVIRALVRAPFFCHGGLGRVSCTCPRQFEIDIRARITFQHSGIKHYRQIEQFRQIGHVCAPAMI